MELSGAVRSAGFSRRAWRGAIIVAALAVLAAVCGFVWLKSLFNESGARELPSLAAHFDAKSILCVFAHPDDEIIAAAFLADAAKRSGVVVRIITATKGESGSPDPPLSRPADLGLVREAETLKHSFALGVAEHEVWSFPDGQLSEERFEELTEEIATRLARWKPDLVITFDPASGLTLHPDHMSIGRAAMRALQKVANAEAASAPPRVLFVLAPRKALQTFGGAQGKQIAARQPAASFAMPSPAAIKIRAWRIHESQAGYLRQAWRLPPWLLYRLLEKEFYALAPPAGALTATPAHTPDQEKRACRSGARTDR